MIGWRVYDVMRTIDWIETRKELDARAGRLHGHLRRRHVHHCSPPRSNRASAPP